MQTKLPFTLQSNDLEQKIPKYVDNRKSRVLALEGESAALDSSILHMEEEISSTRKKQTEIQSQKNLLEILNLLTKEVGHYMNGYLIEGSLLQHALDNQSRLKQLGFHLETDDLSYGWEMEQRYGESGWNPWEDDPMFENKGLHNGKGVIDHENLLIQVDYLDLTVDNDEEGEDEVDTGKRRICLFTKDHLGLIMKSSDWNVINKCQD